MSPLEKQVEYLSKQIKILEEFFENFNKPKYTPDTLLEVKYGEKFTNKFKDLRLSLTTDVFLVLQSLKLVTYLSNDKYPTLTELGNKIIGNHAFVNYPGAKSNSIAYNLSIFKAVPELEIYFNFVFSGDMDRAHQYFQTLPELAKRYS